MRKPVLKIWTSVNDVEKYLKALRHYHYLRANSQVLKGKIKSIKEYKYYDKYLKDPR